MRALAGAGRSCRTGPARRSPPQGNPGGRPGYAATLVDVAAFCAAGPPLENAQPVVLKTTPVAGTADVDPATTELRVTFSKPMGDGNGSWAQVSDDPFSTTTGKPHHLPDGRTCVLPVELKPDHFYVVGSNTWTGRTSRR